MRIVSVEEMKHIENVTNNEFGVGERLIIENVAVKAARVIQKILYTKKIQNEMIFLIQISPAVFSCPDFLYS